VIEDRGLERSQVLTGLKTELVYEMASRLAIDLERFRLSTRAVERDHEQPAQALSVAVPVDQRLELSDEVCVTPESQIGLDLRLDAAEAQLLQSSHLRLSERLIHDIGERGPAPQRQRTA